MSYNTEGRQESSAEMIRRARRDLEESAQSSEIDEIVAELEEGIEKVTSRGTLAHRGMGADTPPSRPQSRERRVTSAYDYDGTDDPFDSDKNHSTATAAVVTTVLLLVSLGIAGCMVFAARSLF